MKNFDDAAQNHIAATAKIYNARLTNSSIGDFSSIADDTILFHSIISSHCKIDRRNKVDFSSIGMFSYTGQNTVIKKASVGKFCSISWNVSIGGQNHNLDSVTSHSMTNFIRWGFSGGKPEKYNELSYGISSECEVGNDVWIGSNAVILRRVKVGNGAVIGAGAVVTHDVEPYTIVVGVPAKPIRKRFDDQTIAALEELQWWDWPAEVIRSNVDLIYNKKVSASIISKLKEIKKGLE
ncbi:MAG: CatB-related O-acetyltransferase [Halomonadaceae bacterium]|jgi:virginiamycin A acetyltransferase